GHKVDSCNTDLHKLFYTPTENILEAYSLSALLISDIPLCCDNIASVALTIRNRDTKHITR
ncbi:hypothetical protein, partial [uncultured Dialister sp.]|uniref:hypothetical protein n=1 Tax=uncultured Dialister sp. TaxID=278064 RepID=UPI00265DF279